MLKITLFINSQKTKKNLDEIIWKITFINYYFNGAIFVIVFLRTVSKVVTFKFLLIEKLN